MRPFSNGTQYIDWENTNCGNCKKQGDEQSETTWCPHYKALAYACICDGEISDATASAIGADKWKGFRNWPCPSADWNSTDIAQSAVDFEEKYNNVENYIAKVK